MAIFAEKTKQETIDTLKETLALLEDTKENVPDEEMVEIVSSLIEKLQHIEDKYFYAVLQAALPLPGVGIFKRGDTLFALFFCLKALSCMMISCCFICVYLLFF